MDFFKKNKEIEKRILDLDCENTDFRPIADGLINAEAYSLSKVKIMWILKEAYAQPEKDDFGGWSLGQAFERVNSWEKSDKSNRLKNMIYVSYGIINDFQKWNDLDYIKEKPEMYDVINQVAYINLKKIPGGKQSNDDEIRKHFLMHKDIVYDQIEAFQPEIIIGGNTMKFLFEDMGISKNQLSSLQNSYPFFYSSTNRVLIDAYHPTNMGKGLMEAAYCDLIIEVAEYWFKNLKGKQT